MQLVRPIKFRVPANATGTAFQELKASGRVVAVRDSNQTFTMKLDDGEEMGGVVAGDIIPSPVLFSRVRLINTNFTRDLTATLICGPEGYSQNTNRQHPTAVRGTQLNLNNTTFVFPGVAPTDAVLTALAQIPLTVFSHSTAWGIPVGSRRKLAVVTNTSATETMIVQTTGENGAPQSYIRAVLAGTAQVIDGDMSFQVYAAAAATGYVEEQFYV